MKLSTINLVFILGLLAIMTGCRDKEKIKSNEDFDRLYFDFAITAEEDAGYVTGVFQFKEGGSEGKTISIEPGVVELDGQKLEVDSAKLSGFFYEIQKSIDSFSGGHVIVFTTPHDKEYKNDFEFTPLVLEKELSGKITRTGFSIHLRDFPSKEKTVRLLLLDTAFKSSGFNDMVPVIDGKVIVSESILKSVKKGPISLALYMEQEIALKEKTIVGGKIFITYGLKRQFELVN